MGRGIYLSYDNEWIEANWPKYRNWLSLCKAYNEFHGTSIKYNTFKSHCNRELALNYHYSDEQKRWLAENYPKLGRVKCAEEFNAVFGEFRTVNAIKVECVKLGLLVSDKRKKDRAIENTGRFHEVGTVVRRGSKSKGEAYVKTEDGWKREKDLAYGKKPDGYILIHLDNDVTNNSSDNIRAIPRSINARMTANRFWSADPVITETGILCCELEEALIKENRHGDTV